MSNKSCPVVSSMKTDKTSGTYSSRVVLEVKWKVYWITQILAGSFSSINYWRKVFSCNWSFIICLRIRFLYCMSKKSCPILYHTRYIKLDKTFCLNILYVQEILSNFIAYSLHKIGQDLLAWTCCLSKKSYQIIVVSSYMKWDKTSWTCSRVTT